ncbi:MAG: hypothetical protein ACTHJ4_02195 [Candidatus Nucleicultricaceae bacterium]
MDSRNNFLHGNVDIKQYQFEKIFFDGNIPLFNDPNNWIEKSLLHTIKYVEPEIVLKELKNIKDFIDFIMNHLDAKIREQVRFVLYDDKPGYNVHEDRVGNLLPNIITEMYVGDVEYFDF